MMKQLIFLLLFTSAIFAQSELTLLFDDDGIVPVDDSTYFTMYANATNYPYIAPNNALTVDGITDSAFWISAWVKLSPTVDQTFIEKGSQFVLSYLQSVNKFYFTIYSQENLAIRIRRISSVQSAQEGNWVHLIATYNGNGASTGMDIYVNKVAVDATDGNAGTFAEIGNAGSAMFFKPTSNMFDIRYGHGNLSAGDIDSIYNHKYLGDEILILPCDEGYGEVLHNVALNKNMALNATFIVNSDGAWDSSQTIYSYRHDKGYTKVGNYRFPYYVDSTPMFREISCMALFGQSNAGRIGDADSLVGSDTLYFEKQEHSYLFQSLNSFNYPLNINDETTGNTTIGVYPFITAKYDSLGEEAVFFWYSRGSTPIYDTLTYNFNVYASANDFANYIMPAIDTSLYYLLQNGRVPNFQSVIWVQGEADADMFFGAREYYQNVKELIDTLRDKTTASLNFQIIKLQDTFNAGYDEVVKAAQDSLGLLANVDAITSDGWESYGNHYNTDGLKSMAYAVYQNIKNINLSTAWFYAKYGLTSPIEYP